MIFSQRPQQPFSGLQSQNGRFYGHPTSYEKTLFMSKARNVETPVTHANKSYLA
jgi:hypothetical protein